MNKFFVIINESNEESWPAYVWNDIKEKAEIIYDNNVLKTSFFKKMKKIHFGNKLNKRIWFPLKSIWDNYLSVKYQELDASNRNFLIFQSSIKFSPSYIKKLKKEKNAVIVQYLPDTLSKLGIANNIREFERYKKYYCIDMVFSFDQMDCAKYNLSFFDIYSSNRISTSIVKSDNHTDLFYVGNARSIERTKTLHMITEKLKDIIKFDFYIIGVDNEDEIYPELIHYNQPLTYNEVIDKTNNSYCILEIMNEDQMGNTLRFKEAVCYNKKLLTNNVGIKNSTYYDERFMYIFEDVDDIDLEWIMDKSVPDYKYSGEFSPLRLLDMILEYYSQEADK